MSYRIRYITHGAFEQTAYADDAEHAATLKEGLQRLQHVTEVSDPEPVEEEQ